MQAGLNFRLLLLDLRFLTFQTFKLKEEKVQHDCINNPGLLVHLIFSLTVSAIIFLSSFQFCNADSCAAFFKLWPGLNSLICARLVPCVRHVRDDCFQRTSQADGQILPRADSLSIFGAAAYSFALCYQAGD